MKRLDLTTSEFYLVFGRENLEQLIFASPYIRITE